MDEELSKRVANSLDVAYAHGRLNGKLELCRDIMAFQRTRPGKCSHPDCVKKNHQVLIVHRGKMLCAIHNADRLRERKLAAGKIPKLKKRAVYSTWKSKQRIPVNKRKRQTGEGILFLKIWDERPHICTNCKTPLGDEPLAFHFAHIVPKSRGERLRLDPANLMLLCFRCHRAYDHGTKEQYHQRTRE